MSSTSVTLRIGPEVAATLAYRLFDAEGSLVEAGGEQEPLDVLFGFAQLPVEVEQALEGAAVGESRTVLLSAERAFGPRLPDAMLEVDRGELSPEARVGDELEAENNAGQTVFLRVVELDEERAVLDANHPLAGQSIQLELRVLSARIASRDEVEAADRSLSESIPDNHAWVSASRLVRRARRTSDSDSEG